MARTLSQDLRDCVIGAVDGGMSCRAAAAHFGVSASSAIRWRRLALHHGQAVARPRGGDRHSGRIEAHGDFIKGLVFTTIWTANVKHVTNTAPAVSQTVLPDELRLPVSILAISNSLRLPYETVRRHAQALEKAGICHRVGRQGLVVPAETHRKLASGTVQAHGIVTALFAELRRAGLKA